MLSLEGDVITVTIPEGKKQEELVSSCRKEVRDLVKSGVLYGKDIKLFGRLATGMSLALGHELAHVCKSVAIFDPKENWYIICVSH